MQQSIIGKVIDNYEITGILGKGGMGVVYRAKDMTLDRDVALKMMDASVAQDEEFLKRFKSEAKALAKLQNPNIVSVFALRETELGFCLVMEFVEGGTLSDQSARTVLYRSSN
jgi:serine/threonine protein kinase